MTEDDIWEHRRDQPHPPTPGNPALHVNELREGMWRVHESPPKAAQSHVEALGQQRKD